MFQLSKRAAKIKPLALMRLPQINDPDELLKKFNKDDIVVEGKLDGWKIQIIKTDGEVHLYSRRGDEKTKNFPDLVKQLDAAIPDNSMVEGELVYWHNNKQDVDKVTSIAGSSPENAEKKLKELPGTIKIHLYDVLWYKGKNVAEEPFKERRKLLESIKTSNRIQITKQYPFSQWQDAINEAIKNGGEGIVLKIKSKPYKYNPITEKEPKPAGIMYKYKGSGGKEETDDYVIYDYKLGDKGKLKAQFGQYYKGDLYHISEISNFSKENEEEIKKRLKSGAFVMELKFQERVPKGLRHARFVRFRDDKKPKDATMNEFHAKHIDKLKKISMLLSKRASMVDNIIIQLQRMVGKTETQLKSTPELNVENLFKVLAFLESGGKAYAVGDAGTSFGPTQVHGPYFMSRLSRMPNVEETTGLTSQGLQEMSRDWVEAKQILRRADLWNYVPLNQDEVFQYIKNNPKSVVRRLEGTFVRYKPNMIAVKRGNRFVGKTLDLNVLQNLGININSPVVKREIEKIFTHYITDNVARSGVAQLFVLSQNPNDFIKFKRTFNRHNIKNDENLSNLIENVSKQDFMSKVNTVLNCLEKSDYNVNAPGAFNIYQLLIIANASGAGRVCQFLLHKKPFSSGNLHYIQSARFRKTLGYLMNKHPELSSTISQLLMGLPPNKGMLGFSKMAFSKRAREDITQVYKPIEQRYYSAIYMNIHRLLQENPDLRDKMEQIFNQYGKQYYDNFSAMIDRTLSDFVRGNIDYLKQFDSISILKLYFDKYWNVELNIEIQKEDPVIIEETQSREDPTQRIASVENALYFPGSYVNDIKEGRRSMTIRANDIPAQVGEVVKCMTYSGGYICDVLITSKEQMNLTRIEKAFGKYMADTLERKFGPESRFMVIRFDKQENFADDDEEKMSEVLIEKDGIKLTRGEIKKHYLKPEIKNKIMSRIKDKPILIYIGVGKNQNILKRNHNEKPIIITNADPNKKDDPNNYYYWVGRRLLSIHEVFGNKTNIGFVDLDLHGNYSLSRAKKYAKELVKKIKNKFNVSPIIYQSGGTGLHIEFKFKEEKDIDKLRDELKELLTEINEDWEDVTTGVIKGSGMRTDITTLHNKGSIRVPGALGETYGKVKKPVGAQEADDWNRYSSLPETLEDGSLDTGAIVPMPPKGVAPLGGDGFYNVALSKRELLKFSNSTKITKEYIWFWDPINKQLIYHLNWADGQPQDVIHTHTSLASAYNVPIRFSLSDFRGYVYFLNDAQEGEIHLYSGDPKNMPEKLQKSLINLSQDVTPEIKKIEVPKGTGAELWKSQEKHRQLEEHMEKRRWMGYKEPDPEFIKQLEIKFASKKKNILILVAPNEFFESEYSIPKGVFVEKFGFKTTTISSGTQAQSNRETIIDITDINTVDANDYDGLFVVGGKGMIEYSKDKTAQKLLKSFIRQKKPVALICHAPLLAAEAGLIRGKDVTGWPEIMKSIIKAKGKWTGLPIEKDGLLFTAIGPDDAENFAWVFANFLLNKPTLGPAQDKYLAWKDAARRIGAIWKIAGILDEELAEGLKEDEGEGEEEDIAEKWLRQFDPTQKKEKIPETLKEKPEEATETKKKKTIKQPKRTIWDQIEGEIPPELLAKRKKDEPRRKKGPRMEYIDEDDFDDDENDFYAEMAKALGAEPISKEEIKTITEVVSPIISKEQFEQLQSHTNEFIETIFQEFFKEIVTKSPEELTEYIVDEKTALKEANEGYNKILMEEIKKNLNIEISLEEIKKLRNEQKETENMMTGRDDEDISHGEQYAFDDMIALTEEERKEKKPKFTDKLVPFENAKGKVIDTWPTIQIPEMTPEIEKFFSIDKIDKGFELRRTFNDERAWQILRQNPHLLQKWILPNIIMTIGYKWFELNSVKESLGKRAEKEGLTFRHLQGGAPFSMFEEVLNPEIIKKLQDGYMEISDLPEAKEYIQHINKLIPELLNVYIAKENATVPIDSYIYEALNNEMMKIVAEKRDFKQERYPVCSICKMEKAPEFALERMERIGRGRWSCSTCKRKSAEIESEISFAKRELQTINNDLNKISKSLSKTDKIELINQLNKKQEHLNIKKNGVEKEISDLTTKKNLYDAQTNSVPYFHTLCPNPKCKLRRIPLTAVDWEHSIWKTEEGRQYKQLLKKEFGIIPPIEMEQDADELSEEDIAEIYQIPKKIRISKSRNWLLNVPFQCPYDGIKFKMKDVRGQGYRNMAGFFYYPWETTYWAPKGEKEKKKYGEDPQYSPINKGPELEELGRISDIAVDGALHQYYQFYNYLRHLDIAIKSGKKYGETFEVDGETYTIPRLSSRQKKAFARELLLYKSVSDFAIGDTQSYLYWLAGSQIVNRPLFIDGKLVRSNVLKKVLGYQDRREQIYLPVLQDWVDKMTQFPDYMEKFNLNEWLVQVGDKMPDGTYSQDGIASDGPGTYFIAKIENNVNGKDNIYGFSCNLESKRKKDEKYKKYFDAKGPRILKILDVWPLEKNEISRFTPEQQKGTTFVSKNVAESIIETPRDNLIGDVVSYDFHNVKISGERSRLAPDNYVLVRAFIMPGKFKLSPLEMMRGVQQNKRDLEFWDKFAELVRAKADNPEYWKKFKEKVESQKGRGFDLEDMISRELFKIKKKSNFVLSVRANLKKYKSKRQFDETPEPEGEEQKGKNKHRFVIQRHFAHKAGQHFDLRLENDDGTMSSWSIPKHKLPSGKEKLLAVKTEDHPISYNKFEGTIPEGEYGAGEVEIYDKGTYEPIEYQNNKIIFKLDGKKEKGTYNLFKTKNNNWLITKHTKEAFLISKRADELPPDYDEELYDDLTEDEEESLIEYYKNLIEEDKPKRKKSEMTLSELELMAEMDNEEREEWLRKYFVND